MQDVQKNRHFSNGVFLLNMIFVGKFFNRGRKDVEISFYFIRCSKAPPCLRTTNPKRVFIFLKTSFKVLSFIVAIADRIFDLSSEIVRGGCR